MVPVYTVTRFTSSRTQRFKVMNPFLIFVRVEGNRLETFLHVKFPYPPEDLLWYPSMQGIILTFENE